MKIKYIIRILSILLCIIPICVFIYFEMIGQTRFDTYNSNKILIIILEVINIGITLLVVKNKDKLCIKYIIILILYLIIIIPIPCYNMSKTYAPTGPGSEFMGLALERTYRDIFGINLKWME